MSEEEVNKIIEVYDEVIADLKKENQKLKGAIETYDILLKSNVKSTKVIEELEKYLKEEQERLVREVSPIYEDGLGKTRLVNEIVYDEIMRVLDKLKQLQEEGK